MKKFCLFLTIFFSFTTYAAADVCYDIEEQAADKAVEIIQKQNEIYKYCSICLEAKPKIIKVQKVQNRGTVDVNDISIDVAHAYYKQGNKFINLGVASGCIKAGEYGISAELDSLPQIIASPTSVDEKNTQIKHYTCEEISFPKGSGNEALLSIFHDIDIAKMTNICFKQKIKNSSSSKQFKYYENIYKDLEALFGKILFYKGNPFEQKIAVYEMLYMFQNYFYAKLMDKQSDEFSFPYQYQVPSERWNMQRPLEQEILKLSNIEARRDELQHLFLATNNIGNFYYHLGIHNTDLLREKEIDFTNMVYNLVMKVKDDEYFTNPSNSTQFFNDCITWEIMTGKTATGWDTKNPSCPIPFP